MKENTIVKTFLTAYDLMLEENLWELAWESKGERIYIRRRKETPVSFLERSGFFPEPAAATVETAEPAAPSVPREFVKSPITGIFYRAGSPDNPPLVAPPCSVKQGMLLCIVEAMKVMNEIRADRDMDIVEVLVKDGAEVKEGQPLFLLSSTVN